MGVLSKMLCANWSTTTLLDVLNDAELLDEDVFDVEHLELSDGRDYLVAVVSGEKAQRVAELLEQLRSEEV